ncbi:MAG: acyl-CoA dehydrogenase family protein [Deltaproteobacteria bacterium]|nr:acyl-CoA dehydrogenase family protein [Deltaproteobacteria bacterium]
MTHDRIPKGIEFLFKESLPEHCFIPEDLTDEHRMIRKTSRDFAHKEVIPRLDRIDAKDETLIIDLLHQAGELGLLAIDVPEAFGGLGLDKISSVVVAEELGSTGTFSVILGGATGIGSLPIVFFGNDEQKDKYLPDLASGAAIGAFALTESGAGSDAIGGCRTKAVLSAEGTHYVLNGEKVFITNAGWADSFIVFANLEGSGFSAFIVERSLSGVQTGAEEVKMGIKGSSTTTVVLEDVRVPVDNLLHEPGKGHVVALNVLNIGRFKLGASAIGACKIALKSAVGYAKSRVQFKVPISDFGAIREKLARMATRLYMGESAVYRAAGLIDASLETMDTSVDNYAKATAAAIREYVVECAINKVYCTEALDFIVDECVQIHGGYGYVAEYPADRYYRDARINRIFEGTNEINRLLIAGDTLKRAAAEKLPLIDRVEQILEKIGASSFPEAFSESDPLGLQERWIWGCKELIRLTASAAVEKLGRQTAEDQELLTRLADMIIETFVMESGLLRARKVLDRLGVEKARFYVHMVQSYVDEQIPGMAARSKEALAYLESGEKLSALLKGMDGLLDHPPVNGINIRRDIASVVVEKEGYPLD